MKSEKSYSLAITVKLNEETLSSLNALCLLYSKKRSEVIRKFIMEGVQQYLATQK